jgi:hypothetical protein
VLHQIETDDGFFQVIGRAHAKGPDDTGDFVLAGDDDDRRGVFVFGQGGQDLETVDLGQAQIEQHGLGPFISGQGKSLTTIGRFQGRIAALVSHRHRPRRKSASSSMTRMGGSYGSWPGSG